MTFISLFYKNGITWGFDVLGIAKLQVNFACFPNSEIL